MISMATLIKATEDRLTDMRLHDEISLDLLVDHIPYEENEIYKLISRSGNNVICIVRRIESGELCVHVNVLEGIHHCSVVMAINEPLAYSHIVKSIASGEDIIDISHIYATFIVGHISGFVNTHH